MSAPARAAARIVSSIGVLLLVSCGPRSSSSSMHAPLPQVEDNGGGILTAPQITTVTFDPSVYTVAEPTDFPTLLSDLQEFDDGITSTQWWTTVTADYADPKAGPIGMGSAGSHVSIAELPPGDGMGSCGGQPEPCYTDSAIGGSATLRTYLAGLFSAGTLPAPGSQSLYVFFLPQAVSLVVDGEVSCQDIGGYHDSLTVGSLDVPYAMVPICDPEQTAPGSNTPVLTVEQTATITASHEIVEATTDPHGGEVPAGGNPNSTQNLGWYLTDDASQVWAYVAGGEVADLCVDVLGLGQDRWVEGNYTYQRIWSNSNAEANHDPCVPVAPGSVYFNTAPTFEEDEETVLTTGHSATFQLTPFADGAISTWQMFGSDDATVAILSFTPGVDTPAVVHLGSQLSLSIELTQPLPMQPGEPAGTPPFEPYILVSSVMSGGKIQAHYWPGFVLGPQ